MKQVVSIPAFIWSTVVLAQKPSQVPSDTGPISFESVSDVVLYLVLPVVIVIFYFVWKRKKKKKESSEN